MTKSREEIYDDLKEKTRCLEDMSASLWSELNGGEPSDKLSPHIHSIIDQLTDEIAPVFFELKDLEDAQTERLGRHLEKYWEENE